MKVVKSLLCGVIVWFSVFLCFIIFQTQYNDPPNALIIATMLVPIIVAILSAEFVLHYSRSKQEKSNKQDISDISILNIDELVELSKKVILETNMASASILERKLGISYQLASKIMKKLENEGFVSKADGIHPREILVSSNLNSSLTSSPDQELSKVDSMEGHDFEYWCADLLKKLGFENVEVTPGSGDQGVDVLAEKGGVKYAIQCKCYSHDLGNTPIQEVESGRIFYGCHVGAVMTNRYFTIGAKELAKKTGTLLWDRDFLLSALGGK